MTLFPVGPFQRRLLRWYAVHQRDLPWRRSKNPYHIWVSEVMLQQTQVATVGGYYRRFLQAFPGIETLAAADLQDVLKLWEGLGYYARAANLHRAARQIVAGGKKRVPRPPEAFGRLPGVGDYINAAVLSIAFGHPLPVVDGNVKRVLARLFLLDEPVNRPANHRVFLEKAGLLLVSKDPGTFNQAMMELGALVCKPGRPLCDQCPVASFCGAHQAGRVPEFPRHLAARKNPHHHLAVGLVKKGGRFLIVQRPATGLLAGLWEMPGGRVEKAENPADACCRAVLESVGLTVLPGPCLARVSHAYTHLTITMDLFACDFVSGRIKRNGYQAHHWIRMKDIGQYPFHRAMHKAFAALADAPAP